MRFFAHAGTCPAGCALERDSTGHVYCNCYDVALRPSSVRLGLAPTSNAKLYAIGGAVAGGLVGAAIGKRVGWLAGAVGGALGLGFLTYYYFSGKLAS